MIVVEWFQDSGRSHEWFGQTGDTIATIESKGTSAVASVIGPRGPAGTDGADGDDGATGATGPTGATGATGADSTVAGPKGADGADGQGVPVGGTTGQSLTKIDGTDYNTEWTTPSGISSVEEDETPKLGGDLDVNGKNITSAAGLDIAIGALSGNDFTVDTDKLVVTGDTGNVGIGMTNPVNKVDIYDTNSAVQAIALRAYGTNTGNKWAGRIVAGGTNVAFIMGEYNAKAWLGAHNAAMNSWADFYINPDGLKKLYLGHYGNSSIMTVNNSNGNVGIGTTTPSEKLDINADAIRIRTASTPASATATGAVGEIRWNSDYIYVCTATDTWKRTAITTWV